MKTSISPFHLLNTPVKNLNCVQFKPSTCGFSAEKLLEENHALLFEDNGHGENGKT